jgi:hypothetical protein
MGGKLKIKGDMGLAMKLEKLMNQMNSKLWLNFILFLSGIAKSSLSKLISQSAPFGAAPSPQLPLPFFKSKYHSPLSAPIIKGKKEN